MCIAILKTKNSKISRKNLEASAENNPDGFGVAWTDGQRLRTFKTMKAGEWIDKVMGLEKATAIIHARIRTHGETDLENCHPFRVSKGLAFIHNGCLPISTASNGKRSDTWHFNNKVVQPLVRDVGGITPPLVELLHEYAKGSKLCFLDYRGKFIIINETAGHWAGGVWYSNSSYKNSGLWWKGGGYTCPPSYYHRSPVQIVPSGGGVIPIDDEDTIETMIEKDTIKKWEQEKFHNFDSFDMGLE